MKPIIIEYFNQVNGMREERKFDKLRDARRWIDVNRNYISDVLWNGEKL